jgi:hypothetical protein
MTAKRLRVFFCNDQAGWNATAAYRDLSPAWRFAYAGYGRSAMAD